MGAPNGEIRLESETRLRVVERHARFRRRQVVVGRVAEDDPVLEECRVPLLDLAPALEVVSERIDPPL
jgi:hypothetical protein